MDAIEFMKERKRMCKVQKLCGTCPIGMELCDKFFCKNDYSPSVAEKVVSSVEKWAKEHPIKTRQSEFLKMFPNAQKDEDDILYINPCIINTNYTSSFCTNSCSECRKKYWSQEIEQRSIN